MTSIVNFFALGGGDHPLQGTPLLYPSHTILHDNELQGQIPG